VNRLPIVRVTTHTNLATLLECRLPISASRLSRKTDFTEDLKAFDVQTLILHGDDDQIVPQASDDDRDGYDHPASSAARLLMRTGLFSALFVESPTSSQQSGFLSIGRNLRRCVASRSQ
jgi:alpha-beta hydrolase superfamily lysophospholipase